MNTTDLKELIPPHVADIQGQGIVEFYTPEQVVEILSLLGVSKTVAKHYAEFCIRCDREKLPLLCLEDYIKQYCV